MRTPAGIPFDLLQSLIKLKAKAELFKAGRPVILTRDLGVVLRLDGCLYLLILNHVFILA